MRQLMRRAPTLTRRGWAMAIGSVTLAVAGRVLGVFELFVLAAACAGLVVAGLVAILSKPVQLEAHRRLHPPRVHAGGDTRVELVLRNRGRRPSPVVAIRDSFRGGPTSDAAPETRGRARFLVAPLRPGREERASYRLAAERRGRYTLGPLEVDRGDAFGLVSSVRVIAASTQLTVYPRVDAIAAMPTSPGSIASGTYLPTAVGSSGEEFYGLREYQVGDDMRRVHWPSTARLDELIVRQLELPWEGRATVVLDARESSHDDESIDVSVSAAASIVLACWRNGSAVRLVSTDGFDSGSAKGPDHLEAILEYLAVVYPASDPRPGPAPGGQARRERSFPTVALPDPGERGVAAVVTTSAASVDDLAPITGRRRQGRITVVMVDKPDQTPRYGLDQATPFGGATVVRVSAADPMATAWSRAMAKPAMGPGSGAGAGGPR